jgi:hypothetical protein
MNLYTALLHTHSSLRYLVLIFLIVVIVKSTLGLVQGKPFTKLDNTLSLVLLIVTHVQMLVGLFLYFVSPFVKFGADTMKAHDTRYWTVEHSLAMILAVVLITVARSTSKKLTQDSAKFKRLSYLNTLALVVIVLAILMSRRGLV